MYGTVSISALGMTGDTLHVMIEKNGTRMHGGVGIIYHSCSRPMGTDPGVLSFLNIFLGSHLSLLHKGP
jgi:hypothetical protein